MTSVTYSLLDDELSYKVKDITWIKARDIQTTLKYMTVVVSNICPPGCGNKTGRSPLTGNSCVERHVHSCKTIRERIENFHRFFFSLFLSERGIPLAYRQQLFSHEAEDCIWEEGEVRISGDDDCISVFTGLESFNLERLKVVPKAKENVTLRPRRNVSSAAASGENMGGFLLNCSFLGATGEFGCTVSYSAGSKSQADMNMKVFLRNSR